MFCSREVKSLFHQKNKKEFHCELNFNGSTAHSVYSIGVCITQ
jgi:hypothetical protein